MDDPGLEEQLAELVRIPLEIAARRQEISELAARRRDVADRVVEVLGPTATAKRLGISRQTLWQVLNPTQSKEIKQRSARRAGGRDIPS